MASNVFESRRSFLTGLLATAGGAAVSVLAVGCSAEAPQAPDPVNASGPAEVVPVGAHVTYANVMPSKVASVRLLANRAPVLDWSTSKNM